MSVFGRLASQSVDPLFLVWFRGILGLALLLPFLLVFHIPILGTHRLTLMLRAIVGCIGVSLVFLALKWIPAGDASSLFKTSTLYVPFIAAVTLKEDLSARIVCLCILGFIGALLIIQPGFAVMNRGIFYALLAGFVHAFVYVTLRNLSSREHALTVVAYFLGGSAVFSSPFVSWPTTLPSFDVGLAVIVVAVTGLVGQIYLTRAYAHAPAAQVTPFLYAEVIFASLLGWLLLAEAPNKITVIGMLLIVTSGIMLSRLSYSSKVPLSRTDPDLSS